MLTIADEGGEGGQAIADDRWLDHQRQRVIDRLVPEMVVQLLET